MCWKRSSYIGAGAVLITGPTLEPYPRVLSTDCSLSYGFLLQHYSYPPCTVAFAERILLEVVLFLVDY